MTLFLIILAAKYLPWAIVLGLVFTAGFMALIVGHMWWSLMRSVSYDLIAFYGEFKTAQGDAEKKKLHLEVWKLQARAQLRDRRAMLQAGSAAMWKSGAYDVEIEDAAR